MISQKPRPLPMTRPPAHHGRAAGAGRGVAPVVTGSASASAEAVRSSGAGSVRGSPGLCSPALGSDALARAAAAAGAEVDT